MKCAIVTDTSANLPLRMVTQYGLTVIPFSYYVEGEENVCTDIEAFDGAGYYSAMRAGGLVTTSQITPQRYLDAIEPLLAEGQDILFIGMSSGISGSFSSARLAMMQLAERYPERKLRLVDTRGASLGEGLLVLRAAEMLRGGASIDETAARVRALRERMCQVFTVDDLMYLRRTGRLSNAAAVVATLLRIKPLLIGDEMGRIVNFAKASGRRRAVEALAQRYDEHVVNPKEQIVGIAQADCPEDAQYLRELLCRSNPPKEILTVCYEPVTGAHVGPGALALFFLGGEDARSH